MVQTLKVIKRDKMIKLLSPQKNSNMVAGCKIKRQEMGIMDDIKRQRLKIFQYKAYK